ncbi:MAG TPA: CBS domain-containing protein [Myxococcales bacterium]|jgi:CBS domain-containing protein
MKVSDILKKKGHQVFTIAPERSLLEAATLLAEHGVGAVVVVEADGSMLGIFTERDLVRECAGKRVNLERIPVGEAMTRDVVTCHPDDDLRIIEAQMRERGFRHLPVLEDGKSLVGIVSIRDVLAGLYESAKEDANDLRDHLAGHYVVC